MSKAKKAQVKIETLPIAKIKPYWRNPRINIKTVPALKKSIERYGFQVPLVVDKDYVIVTGHARYKALLQMGVKEVPCVVSDLSHDKHREYRILDNKIQDTSKWDTDTYIEEMKELFGDGELVEFFGDTLDSVVNISHFFQAPEEDTVGLTDDGAEEEDDLVDDEVRCPYCEGVLTEADIVEPQEEGE